ncbi:helix-turn-helix transcriptional regulator [Kribbella amoyensis]|nr:WYL domain-containing protein [Kribbella amoyensis]
MVAVYDASPTARALLVLEFIQNSPGISAERLADRLGVTERAVRRYVGILREAEIPIESSRGRYGGYRIGRGLRVPPLMFSTPEALGLVMAMLEAEHGGSSTSDPVENAIGKIVRVLPEPLAQAVDAIRSVATRGPAPKAVPDPELTASLVRASTSRRRVRIGYRLGEDVVRAMDVDPWSVVVRHGRWYLLCWSHAREARRVLRVDRIASVEVLAEGFELPAGLDAFRTLEEHLAEGWKYQVEVVIEAPVDQVSRWIPRNLGRLEALEGDRTRLVASTDEPYWYARQLTALHAPFRIVGSDELRSAALSLARGLSEAAS